MQRNQQSAQELDGLDGQAMGCHPLKKLKRQSLDEFEDEFMSQSRPAAKVVNMRAKIPEPPKSEPAQNLPESKEVEAFQGVFSGIREHTEGQTNHTETSNQADQRGQGKKKVSLFAQKRAQMKQKQLSQQSISRGDQPANQEQTGDSVSFPVAFKVYEKKQSDVKQISLKQGITQKSELDQIGVGDQAINQENMKKILEMSPEDIAEAQRQIKEMLGTQHAGALQKFKSNFGKSNAVLTKGAQDLEEQATVFESKKQSLFETGQVSEAIHSAASQMESQTRTARKVAINSKGKILIDQEIDQDEGTRYLSYIIEEDFQNLDDRYFHVDEISNLLGSSHHQHRLYAVNLLTKLFSTLSDGKSKDLTAAQKQTQLIFGTVFNPDVSQIPERLCNFIQSTSGSMLDSSRNICMLLNAQMKCLFDELQQYRDYSYHAQAHMKGLRLFQVYLSDTIQGGSLFDPSALVPCSQQALAYFDMLFDNKEVLVLLAKSIEKLFTHSLEMMTSSQQEAHHFEADCVTTVLETLLWFSLYSPQTSQLTEKMFIKAKDKILALVASPAYESVWSSILMILRELMLSGADLNRIFQGFIQPHTNIFTQNMLKELTTKESKGIGLQFIGILKLVSLKQVNLLGKEYVSNLNVTFIEVAQRSTDWTVLSNLSQFLASLSGEYTQMFKPVQLLLDQNEANKSPDTPSPIFDSSQEEADQKLMEILTMTQEPRVLQSSLACLNQVKHQSLRQLKNAKDGSEIGPLLSKILRLLNSQDEPIFHDLVMDYLFKPDCKVCSIDGQNALILVNFFLGYCSSNEQVEQACLVSMLKKPLKARDFFLPLLDDWFIRPLFFVDKLDEQAFQNLTRAILVYAKSYFANASKTESRDLLRVTEDEFAMVAAYLVSKKLDEFSEQNLLLIDQFIDEAFFKVVDGDLQIGDFRFSKNTYLIQAYKQTFLQDNFVQTLSNFFNQRPVDQCPTMYKILLITLNSLSLSLENRKTLLSEISEVLPAIFRQEKDLVPSLQKTKLRASQQPQEVLAYHKNFVDKPCFEEFSGEDKPLLLKILAFN